MVNALLFRFSTAKAGWFSPKTAHPRFIINNIFNFVLIAYKTSMKRFLLLFPALLLFLSPLKAQQFKVGLLAGVNISDVDGMDPVDFDNDFHKFGFTVGGLVSTHIAEKTFLQMEIAYSQLGSSNPPDTSQANFNNNFYYTFRLNYINVDLALRHKVTINFSKKPNSNFTIDGGVSVGYMFKYYYTAQSLTYPLDLNTKSIAGFVGFGYNFTPNILIDLRYYNAFISDFANTPSNSQFLYYGSWNRGHNISFQITFKFMFGSDTEIQATPDNSGTPPKN